MAFRQLYELRSTPRSLTVDNKGNPWYSLEWLESRVDSVGSTYKVGLWPWSGRLSTINRYWFKTFINLTGGYLRWIYTWFLLIETHARDALNIGYWRQELYWDCFASCDALESHVTQNKMPRQRLIDRARLSLRGQDRAIEYSYHTILEYQEYLTLCASQYVASL